MTTDSAAEEPRYSADTVIAEAIAGGPAVAAVFLRYRMYCIGCTFARFENLQAAAFNHQADVDEFVDSLNAAVRQTGAPSAEGSIR